MRHPTAAATAFVVSLVAATAAVFAVTQEAKLEHSPIFATRVSPVFSPACGPRCRTRQALIDFDLRSRERLTVWMERDGRRLATLVPGRVYAPGHVALVFEGVADDGLTLPDGVYRPVVHLDNSHRTIVLPNPIRLDTRAPVVHVPRPQHAILSPDGDGRNDVFRTPYRLEERAHAILLANDRRVELTRAKAPAGTLAWNGKLAGRPARPRNYVLYASARDAAGNVAEPVPFAVVQVRYVALGRKRVVVRPGGRFAIRVSADASLVRWLLHGRGGLARPGTLHLRAPRSKGVFRLYVTVAGHAATAAVVVA